MADLDEEAITVTLPLEDDGAIITEVEKKGDPKSRPLEIGDEDPISDLKGQFETLKGQLSQTTQRLVGTERELDTTKQELANTKKEVATSQLDTVLSGIQAAEAEATTAEKEFIAAAEAGDFAAQARAQRKISAAEARIQRLKEAEGDLKEMATTKPAPRQEPRQQAANDPVEAVAASMAPRAAAWIRSHPDYVTDKAKNAKMLATHYAMLAEGIEEGGNDYFARLDEMANPKQQQQKPEPKVNIRPSAPVAPAGGSSSGMNGGMSVSLTKREVAAATDGTHTWERDSPDGKHKRGDVLGVQEFARRKSIMMRQGLYDRTFNEQ